jgi:hypothetical protein
MTERRSTAEKTANAQAWGDRRPHVFLDVYTGVQPFSADTAPIGTKLVTYSKNGLYTAATDGFSFGTAAAGVIARTNSETVTGTASATGAAGWARLRAYTDAGTTNTTDIRHDFSCGLPGSGADFIMESLNYVTGSVYPLGTFTYTAIDPA